MVSHDMMQMCPMHEGIPLELNPVLKLLEMRSPRDALVVIYLGFFIVATAFLFDQGIPLALYQGFCALILVAALVGLQQLRRCAEPPRA